MRKNLLRADIVLPSLDAVSPEVFEKINRPHPALSSEEVVRGLIEFREMFRGKIWLEILFCKGVNDTPAELEKMKEAVERIRPDLIHLNTVIRPPSESWAIPIDGKGMEAIRSFFGAKAIVISEFDRHPSLFVQGDIQEGIIRILRRRPLSPVDLSRAMGIARDELENCLGSLVNEGRVRLRRVEDRIYYEMADES